MSTRIDRPAGRGRWIRRGGSIILLPDHSPAFRGMEGEVSGGVTATTAGVIDPRIDVFAQRALLRMNASPDPAARADAAAMLAAVKSGALAGIYKEDERVPALRARRLGKSWWTAIPAGDDATVLSEPGQPPLIAFRDRVRGDPARLDPALRKAWRSLRPASCPFRSTRQPAYAAWLRAALARVAGATRPVAFTPVQARSAIRGYQRRKRLPATGTVDRVTRMALAADTGLPVECADVDALCEDTLECGTGAFTGTVVRGGQTFIFCWTTRSFNTPAPGTVDLAAKGRLVFSCHRLRALDPGCRDNRFKPGGCPAVDLCIPAWAYEAVVIAPGLKKPGEWEFGFIQTVRASRWAGLYTGGGSLVCDLSNARDELLAPGDPSRAPWVAPGAVQALCGPDAAAFSDTPRAAFPITHPQVAGATLRQVCFKGTFDIWLAVTRKTAAASAASVQLLAFKQVQVDRRWTLQAGSDATALTSWIVVGGQRESAQTSKPPFAAPVLGGTAANTQAAGCFKPVAGAACPEPGDFPGNAIGGDCVCPGTCG